MADEIKKTPTLGLNKPPAGCFEWDKPINENWDKLDLLGAGQIPLLWHIDIRHKLEGDQLAGWSLQGSELDGSVYTSVWDILWAAKQRATTEYSTQIRGKTYYYFQDAVTGIVFVNDTNYNTALAALGDSLGYVVSNVDGVKRIRLPMDSSLNFPVLDGSLPGGFVDETLPEISGSFYLTGASGSHGAYSGAFYEEKASSGYAHGSAGDATNPVVGFKASRSSSTYQDGARVQQRSHKVYRYYKTGNTIANKELIDVANLSEQLTQFANKSLSNMDTTAINRIKGWHQVNYAAAQSVSSNSAWVAPADGIFLITRVGQGDWAFDAAVTHKATGVIIASLYSAYKYSNGGTSMGLVLKGETYNVASPLTNTFVPFKGEV